MNPEGVTPRMRQVWALMANGQTSKEIASALGITLKTVERHRWNLFRTLNVRNLADVTREAVRHGIITIKVLK